MEIKELELHQFRNYGQAAFRFSSAVNLIYGPNGIGKSNLLEAFTILLWNYTPRTHNIKETIQWGKEEVILRARLIRNGQEQEQELHYYLSGEKELRLNGKLFSGSLRDLWLRYPLVFFFPSDLQLLGGEPVLRRRFLNSILVAVDKRYSHALLGYQRILRERNACLQQFRHRPEYLRLLQAWDEQLVIQGTTIAQERQQLVAQLLPLMSRYYQQLAETDSLVSGGYFSGITNSLITFEEVRWWEEHFRRRLEQMHDSGLRKRLTLVGPQRDDIWVHLDNQPARSFASRGQQRLLILALKLAARDYLFKRSEEQPLIIFDDVFSELDSKHQQNLGNYLESGGQVFLTSTACPVDIPAGRLQTIELKGLYCNTNA